MANYQYNSNPNTISITSGQGLGAIGGGGFQLSSGGGSNGIMAQSLFNSISLNDIDSLRHENVKRYEVIETTEDILALSVAWKRLRDNREKVPVYINSLLSNSLFDQVTNEDREHAIVIRDYFSKKIMLWTLKEIRLSGYRQDLSELIHGDSKKVTDKMLPIAFRLPEFYEYDVEFDKFKQDITLNITQFNNGTHQKVTTLRPIKSFYKNNKRIKQFEYWLKDDKGNAHMIAIEPKNPLKHIWDKLFMNEQLRIEGSYCPKQYDDLQYYRLLNWSLA